MAQGGGPLLGLVHGRPPLGDAPGLLEDPIDRAARARQPLPLHLLIARQVVQQRLGPRRAPQALRRLIAHLEQAVNHGLAQALGRLLPGPRAAVQHLLVVWLGLPQTLLPFLDPAA